MAAINKLKRPALTKDFVVCSATQWQLDWLDGKNPEALIWQYYFTIIVG